MSVPVKRMIVTMLAVSALSFPLSAQEYVSSIKDFWDKVAANPRGHFVLTDDIDAAGYDYSPPTDYRKAFTGTLDGKGKTIYNLRIFDPLNYGWVGLLGYVGKGGVVKDLGVIADTIDGAFAVGILAGGSDGTISGCYTKGKVTARRASSSNVGGLVGVNGGVIRESYSTASVSGPSNVGGLVGMQTVNVSGAGIYDSYTSGGTVTASGANAGGIVGYVFGGSVGYCLAASGQVSATPMSSAGGLIGYDYGSVNTDWKNAGKTGIGTTVQSVAQAYNLWNHETTGRNTTAGQTGDAAALPINSAAMGMTGTYRNWIGRGGVWSFTPEGPRLNNVAVEYMGDGIQKISLSSAAVNVNPPSLEYNGNEQTPALTVIVNGNTLVEGVDYQISSAKNDKGQTGAAAKTDIGVCTLTILGIGGYTGMKTATYSITEPEVSEETDLTKMTVVFDPPSLTYNGQAQTPTLKANGKALVLDTDYMVMSRSSDNSTDASDGTNVGLVTLLILGQGKYSGLTSVSYNITPASVPNISTTLSATKTRTAITVNVGPLADALLQPYDGVELQFALRKAGAEDDLVWDILKNFTGLTPDTEYHVYYRTTSTRNYAAREPGFLTVKTDPNPVYERDTVFYEEKVINATYGETVTLSVVAGVPPSPNHISFTYTWYSTDVAYQITNVAVEVPGGTTASIQIPAYVTKYYFAVVKENFLNGGVPDTRDMPQVLTDVITVTVTAPAPPGSQAEAASAPGARLRGRTLLITASKSAPMTVRLIDMRGRTAARFKASANRVFALPRVPTGRYVMEVKAGRRVVERSSVVLR